MDSLRVRIEARDEANTTEAQDRKSKNKNFLIRKMQKQLTQPAVS
jgi:hypothetical protein